MNHISRHPLFRDCESFPREQLVTWVYDSGTRVTLTLTGVVLKVEYHTGDTVWFNATGRVIGIDTSDGWTYRESL